MNNRTAMKSSALRKMKGYELRLQRLVEANAARPNPQGMGFNNIFVPDANELERFARATGSASFNSEFAHSLAALNAQRPDCNAFAGFRAAFNADFMTADSPRAPLQGFAIVAAENDDLVPQTAFMAADVNTNSVNGIFSFPDRSGGIQTLQSVETLERAINAPPAMIDGKGTQAYDECVPYALASEIDWARYADPEQEMQNRIAEITEIIQLFRFMMAFQILGAIADPHSVSWTTAAGQDPDGSMLSYIVAAAQSSGYRPTRAVIGETAATYRKQSIRTQNNAGGYASANWSNSELASFLGISDVLFSNALSRDQDGTIASVIANKVLLFRNMANATLRDTSIMKTFFAMDHGARYFTQIRQVSEFVWRVCVSYKERMRITGPVAGNPVVELTIANS